jgi:hypothetical protein
MALNINSGLNVAITQTDKKDLTTKLLDSKSIDSVRQHNGNDAF